ncbi:MAG: solute carrier family 23 protein [Anaerolineae bacterium]|nr:MAG: solute carrier family 23 protein [Anaerolineae bacterium]
MTTETKSIDGYLPNDTPPAGKLILLGIQHVLTMFPATVFVAAFTGFHIGTVLLASGISTIVALLLSRNRIGTFIPLFYGSSFSYIAAYLGVAVLMTGDIPAFGVPLPNEVISTMQAGIVVTGVLNILVGFIIRRVGKDAVDTVLPPVVTGSVAAIIGFGLAFAALGMAQANLAIAVTVLFVTVLFSVYLQGRGFAGMLPILLGAIFGFLLAAVVDPESIAWGAVQQADWFVLPTITFPIFTGAFVVTAIASISIMAIATIPESTAHLYQISLYVDRFAEELHREKSHLDKYIGWNLVFDGIGDAINGLLGATAGTNYGENNSLMAITRNYSGPALMMAGVVAILLAFVGKLAALVAAVPLAVTGGLAVYLFGVIGMQGFALMQEHHVSMFNPRNLAVGATIMVIGIGGNIGFEGGFIPVTVGEVFPNGLPAIATAAVLGILMNLIFVIFAPPERAQIAEAATAAAD